MIDRVPEAWLDQSAVVPFRWRKKGVEICLITSLRSGRWIVPKGIIEPDLSPADSAAKEALEEAGVEGRVWPKRIGEYTLRKYGGICRVRTYLMRVDTIHRDWAEAGWRRRRWLDPEDAVRCVHPEGLARILDDVPAWILRLDP